MARRLFRAFTIVLLVVSIWTIYANVLSDNTEVMAHARELANAQAGCGDKCKLVGMRGERGMITLHVEYDIEGKGQYVATCRRSFIVAGDYSCQVGKP